MTYQNLGYWIGQSNDTSTGSHPTGWTNGQRWSETAGEWQTMYSSMSADSTMWHGRADQAWGTSRAWNSGESWEAAYNRVLPPASALQCIATIDTQNASGVFSKLTLGSASGSASGWFDGGNDRIVLPVAGIYYAVAIVGGTSADPNSLDVVIRRSGSIDTNPPTGNPNSTGTSKTAIGAFVRATCGGGQYFEVWAQVHTGTAFNVATAYSYFEVGFIPTQANPH